MVSITLSVPEEIRHKMQGFSEVNWSGLIRKVIIEKTKDALSAKILTLDGTIIGDESILKEIF